MYIHLMYTHIYICMCVLELQASASLQISTNKDASLQINTVNTATDVYICAQITGPHSLSHATCAVTCISICPPTCSPCPHCLCHVASITSILDKDPTLVHTQRGQDWRQNKDRSNATAAVNRNKMKIGNVIKRSKNAARLHHVHGWKGTPSQHTILRNSRPFYVKHRHFHAFLTVLTLGHFTERLSREGRLWLGIRTVPCCHVSRRHRRCAFNPVGGR